MSVEEATTRIITTGPVVARGELLRPRAGHRLRIVEETIPPESLPLDKTLGAPRRPGPAA